MIRDVDSEQLECLINEVDAVFVDMWASWCSPCKIMRPLFEELAEKYSDIDFVRLQIDNDTVAAEKYGIKSIPAFVSFKQGEFVTFKTGIMTMDSLENMINDL